MDKYCKYCGRPLTDNCGCEERIRKEAMEYASHWGVIDEDEMVEYMQDEQEYNPETGRSIFHIPEPYEDDELCEGEHIYSLLCDSYDEFGGLVYYSMGVIKCDEREIELRMQEHGATSYSMIR